MAGPSKRRKSLETLLECALSEPKAALQKWCDLLEWHPLNDFSYHEQRMLPAVFNNLKQAGDTIPEETRLRGVSRYTWAKNAQLHNVCQGVLTHFQSLGIDSIVLKGIYFNSDVHQNLGRRPATDFDILIPWEQADDALDALIDQGWRVKGEWIAPRERLENAVSVHRDGLELDLHWGLLREARDPRFDEIFWEDAVPFQLGTVTSKTLSATHHLFHLLVIAHREPVNRYRYLYDLTVLIERFGEEIDYQQIEPMLRERHLLSRVKSLPLEEIGLGYLLPTSKPTLLDKLWSQATRLFESGQGEWNYFLFPFLDYWINYHRLSTPDWSLTTYLHKRLKIEGLQDLFVRTINKFIRLVRLSR